MVSPGIRFWDDRAQRWRLRRRYVKAKDVPALRERLMISKNIDRVMMHLMKNHSAVLAELGRMHRREMDQTAERVRRLLAEERSIQQRPGSPDCESAPTKPL